MDKVGFKEWLDKVKEKKSVGYRKDLVSRAGRVERAFSLYDDNFSLDTEYSKDGGKSLLELFKLKGEALKDKPINLPVGSNQMCDFATAIRMYFKYKSEKEGK